MNAHVHCWAFGKACSSVSQRAYFIPTASLCFWGDANKSFLFCFSLLIPRDYPDRPVLNGFIFFNQLKEEWRRLRHTLSRPQVGVDNLDKYARSFATILPPSASHLPAHRRCDGRKFQTRSERQVIICHCWWGAALCASRCAPDSPPYMSIGGTAACDPPSCSVLWAHSQFHTEIKCCPSPCLSTDLLWHLRPW